MEDKQITSFLKWPGGKRWFVKKYQDYFPKEYGTYIEPFLGSGAVFFSLQPKDAILSDINKELIDLYIIMRDNPEKLKEQLVYHQRMHCKEYYYSVRETIPTNILERSGRLLYLNRACRLSENSGKHGVKVWDMVSLSQQNHNGGRRHGVHSRSGSESGNSTA